ncbi:DUF3592 domain-containing protein [Streptomyces sp. NPDC051776]|uniref:DUF3592 domain-containing protein n=1 Tax=Streptomyces sp. NPDC051776 TaxID=3155414 RepID=UPI00343C6F1F
MMLRLRRYGLPAPGLVVNNVRVGRLNRSDRRTRHQVPVIEFFDQHGHRVEFSPKMHGKGMGIPTGRRVAMLYLPDRPQKARVHAFRHTLVPPIIQMIVGLVFTYVGIMVALHA